jgi:cell division protease FtsH
MTNTKEKMQQIIDYLQDPAKFKINGSRLRKGVLLYGPPGTGKTLLAKAIAGESGSAFIYRSASEFLEVYVGVGPSRVRKLFEEAKSHESCIIFIDEIDAVGARAKNQMGGGGGGAYELNATVNQLLVEMDGFLENDRIVVIGATNHEKLLEKALIR